MISTKNLTFNNFKKKTNLSGIKQKLKLILSNQNEVLNSLKSTYKYPYSKKFINKFKGKFSLIRIIGMGGSVLGSKAIYNFLNF